MQFQSFSRILICVCAGWGLVLSGCDNPTPPETRFDKIASAYCECTTTLAALNRKVKSLAVDSSGNANLKEYFQQMQTEYDKAKECSISIVAQFGHLNNTELEAVRNSLAQKCPDLAEQRELLREMLGE